MSSVVLDLQNEVTKSKCDIVSVLRRAHLIATKLSLDEFNQWVVNELNGYKSQTEAPEYRSIIGQLKAFNPYQGWIPVMLADAEVEKMICHPKLINSISEILSLCEESGSSLIVSVPTEVQNTLNEMCDTPLPMQMAVHVSKTAAADIIEKVKNTLLEWTLELEAKGILGEDMSFNDKEKEIAKTIPQQINNYYGAANVINGSPDNLQANVGETDLTAKTFDFFPKLQNHTAQAIGSDMRNLFVGNILRGSRPEKPGQDLLYAALFVLDVGRKLSVGEGPGAALTELNV